MRVIAVIKLVGAIILLLLFSWLHIAHAQTTITVQPGQRKTITIIGATPVPTPSPTPTPTATPSPTSTPTTTPTPSPSPTPVTPMSFYFSPSGNDTTGDGSKTNPWATVAKANGMLGSAIPGTQFLFLAGMTWNEMLTLGDTPAHSVNGTAAAPIIISTYSVSLTALPDPYRPKFDTSTLFTLDEQNTRPYCVSSIAPAFPVNGLVISGIECKHATTQAIAFRGPGNKILVPWQQMFQGLSIVGNYVHNDGAGCSQTDGPCVGNDPGGYVNQVVLEDDGLHPHSVYIARNKVQWVGGHNCIQVHGDTGSPIVDSNTVGPGCVHNGIDEKLVGDFTKSYLSRVTNNWINCGFSQGLCGPNNFGEAALFTMNVSPAVNENIMFAENVAYDLGGTGGSLGINIHPNAVPSGCPTGAICPIQAGIYNNTLYAVRGQPQSIGIGESAPGAYGPSSLIVMNNIIDGFGSNSIFVGQGMATAVEDYDDIGGALGSPGIQFNGAMMPGPHSLLNVDPMYVQAPGNFQLKAGSPVVARGQTGLPSGNANIGVY